MLTNLEYKAKIMKYITNEIFMEQQIINFRKYTLSMVIPPFIFN